MPHIVDVFVQPPTRHRSKGGRVLLVDDSAEAREVHFLVLKRLSARSGSKRSRDKMSPMLPHTGTDLQKDTADGKEANCKSGTTAATTVLLPSDPSLNAGHYLRRREWVSLSATGI
jgi:hypothetical protein